MKLQYVVMFAEDDGSQKDVPVIEILVESDSLPEAIHKAKKKLSDINANNTRSLFYYTSNCVSILRINTVKND